MGWKIKRWKASGTGTKRRMSTPGEEGYEVRPNDGEDSGGARLAHTVACTEKRRKSVRFVCFNLQPRMVETRPGTTSLSLSAFMHPTSPLKLISLFPRDCFFTTKGGGGLNPRGSSSPTSVTLRSYSNALRLPCAAPECHPMGLCACVLVIDRSVSASWRQSTASLRFVALFWGRKAGGGEKVRG